MTEGSGFDAFSRNYDQALHKGLALSGEGRDFFAHGRIKFLRTVLLERGVLPRRVIDFGCGTGDTIPFIDTELAPEAILGVDASEQSLAVARSRFASGHVFFEPPSRLSITREQDLVYCNGVFHHIPLVERASSLQILLDTLREGGFLSLWENNPWNPGARLVMRRIPFDHDAIMLFPHDAVRLARDVGFEVVRVDFLFLFPHFLRVLRPLEQALTRLPLGAQYQVLCRRP